MDISRMRSFPAHVLGINSSTICFCYDTAVFDIPGLSWDVFQQFPLEVYFWLNFFG